MEHILENEYRRAREEIALRNQMEMNKYYMQAASICGTATMAAPEEKKTNKNLLLLLEE